ncbi:FliH/SctL family protein [Rubinisphaera margarita]|uniref:FliH/SctL family protein n=1 Tax=Rubinisphaera margarita TaxID=2909586 RepID=UPI001EE84B04|nr:FliH/SctL family protein [Rubinisphaera margarita]MCG6154506.1 hypothetical protein [Rubinisphaera margarita]
MTTSPRVMKSAAVADAMAVGQFNYEDLRGRCENYLDSVRQQAQQLLTDAQDNAEKIKQAAIKEGREVGLKQGLLEAEKSIQTRVKQEAAAAVDAKLKTVLPSLKQAVAEVHQIRDQAESYWHDQAIDLVMAMTGKLVHRMLERDPGIGVERLQEVLKLVVGQSELQIEVAESDLAALQEELEQVTKRVSQTGVKLIGQAELKPGDYRVLMKYGEIDARVDVQLQRIIEELVGE